MVGVAGEGVDGFDVRPDMETIAEDVDGFRPVPDFPAQGPFGAVADEEDGRVRVLDVVAEVMENASGFAHAGGGNDDRHSLDVVEFLGAFDGTDESQLLEAERVLFLE